jgi:deoxycytidylate deaminase
MNKIKELFQEAKSRGTCHNIRMAAVIETPTAEYVTGWNGPPGRAGDHPECFLQGPITPENLKNCPSVHAEIRAICRAAEEGVPVKGGTIYLSEWFPCAPCAIAIIEAGLSKLVITEEPNWEKDDCYNFVLAGEYLKKSGVIVEIRKNLAEKTPAAKIKT